VAVCAPASNRSRRRVPVRRSLTDSRAKLANVLRLYAQLARDIRNGIQVVPGSAHAVRRRRELAAIESAADSGATQEIG
jgi:hypothetical protein